MTWNFSIPTISSKIEHLEHYGISPIGVMIEIITMNLYESKGPLPFIVKKFKDTIIS